MRVLTVTNCPALQYLGSGYIIDGFVNGLRSLGHDVDLVQPDEYEICQWMRPRAMSYRQAVGMFIATRRALGAKQYDLVEFWGGEAWLTIWWLFSCAGIRPLVVQHSNGPEPRYSQMLEAAGILRLTFVQRMHAQKFVPKAFQLPDAVVTISQYDLEWLEQMQLPRGGRRLAIEVPLSERFLDRPAKVRESRVIGFCGTWLPRKGLGVIVPDIARLLRDFGDWRFLVLGTGENDRVHSSFPEDLRARIEVVPMIADKEALARQYERMEIFVFPSVSESFGIALAEAMACACAPVSTRVGFAATLESGRNAILIDESASPQLYEAVKYLILNPETRKQIASAAHERVQQLRWNLAVRTLSESYQAWLAEHRDAGSGRLGSKRR